MLQKALIILVLMSALASMTAGCYSVGKATGEAAKSVENSADDFKKGYEKGKTN